MTLTRAVFSRLLALVYFIAFLSLWVQIDGLIGSGGILSLSQLLQTAIAKIPGRIDLLPTVFWLSSSDRFLHLVCASGLVLSIVAFLGFAETLVFFLLWALYLSLVSVGGEFLSFQWDHLLLEAGFLMIFFAPLRWREKISTVSPPSPIMVWLFRWLLFRLMLQSGIVKILSGDPLWLSLSALDVHFETQPLPTWIGWWAHQLPVWMHWVMTATMFAVELIVPFFIFLTRRFRLAAFFSFAVFQVVIALTGNYGFFNLLTIALSVLLLDDEFLDRFKRKEKQDLSRSEVSFSQSRASRVQRPQKVSRLSLFVFIPFAAFVFIMSALQWVGQLGGSRLFPEFARSILETIAPFRSINRYGLFAVMTPDRPEIVVEGSADGVTWLAYEFKWKPQDLNQRPAFAQPHMPRLDWQMWFSALGKCEANPWFTNFLYRLLQDSSSVLELLKTNPFPDAPPAYVRSLVYDYRFTDPDQKLQSGAWWKAEYKGEYCQPLMLPH